MEALFGFFNSIWSAYKAREAARAAADLQRGQDILTMARAEAEAMEKAQKALDDQLSAVPAVPAAPAGPVPPPPPKP